MEKAQGKSEKNRPKGPQRTDRDELIEEKDIQERGSHTPAKPKATANRSPGGSTIYRLGQHVATNHMQEGFAYDPLTENLWAYMSKTGTWRVVSPQFLLDYVNARNLRWAQQLRNRDFDEESKLLAWSSPPAPRSPFWSGLRHGLTAPEPMPELHHIATLNGLADLQMGTLVKHAAEYKCRSSVAAHFYPEERADLEKILAERLGRVFTEAMLSEYLDMVALSLSGRAQMFRALMLIYGGSGTGKGGAIRLIVEALGDMATGIGSWYFSRARRPTEIDTISTNLSQKQIRFVAVDEFTGDVEVAESRLLSTLGDNKLEDSRNPYGGKPTGGVARFMLGATAVSAPAMTRHGGIERRLAAIPTKGIQLEKDLRDPTQDELDAIFTLAAMRAICIYQDDYRAPNGDLVLKEDILTTADALTELFRQIAAHIKGDPMGMPIKEVREEVHQEIDRMIQPGPLGQKIAATKLFAQGRGKERDGTGRTRKIWHIDLPENERL